MCVLARNMCFCPPPRAGGAGNHLQVYGKSDYRFPFVCFPKSHGCWPQTCRLSKNCTLRGQNYMFREIWYFCEFPEIPSRMRPRNQKMAQIQQACEKAPQQYYWNKPGLCENGRVLECWGWVATLAINMLVLSRLPKFVRQLSNYV